MTPENMDKITYEIKNLIMNHGWLNYEDTVQAWRLLSVIASLHNELHKEVTGKYYDYMFHWSNLGWMGDVNEDLFKEAGQHQESEKNNKLETWMNRPEEEGKRQAEHKEASLPFDLSGWKDEGAGGCQENDIDTDDFINEIGADFNGW